MLVATVVLPLAEPPLIPIMKGSFLKVPLLPNHGGLDYMTINRFLIPWNPHLPSLDKDCFVGFFIQKNRLSLRVIAVQIERYCPLPITQRIIGSGWKSYARMTRSEAELWHRAHQWFMRPVQSRVESIFRLFFHVFHVVVMDEMISCCQYLLWRCACPPWSNRTFGCRLF